MDLQYISQYIKNEALAIGFDYCGIAKVDFLKEQESRLQQWLDAEMHADMHYMNNNTDKRLNPTLLVENAKSMISLAVNYFPKHQQIENTYKIAKYAYGKDYHEVIKEKLYTLLAYIQTILPHANGRVFVDSAPVMEKAWAQRAGLAWQGKNSCLIIKKAGSFFFFAEIIIDEVLQYDSPVEKSFCGNCNRCVQACPTQAIISDGVIDANKCISYITIENKNEIPTSFNGKMNNWIYGCDICQDVCPHNKFSKANTIDAFTPHPKLLCMQKQEWENLNLETYNEIFRKSAVKRAKFAGLKRNIDFVKNQST